MALTVVHQLVALTPDDPAYEIKPSSWNQNHTITGSIAYGELSGIPSTFAPSAHAASHKSGGSDSIKLDELAAPTDVTTLNASTSAHGLMQKYPGGTTTFLRADGSFAAPVAGAASWTEVEVDFGTTGNPGVYDKTFSITDASVSGSSKIMMLPSGNPATGRGAGDALWDAISYACVAASGSFTAFAKASPGPVIGKRKVLYTVA